MHLLWFIWPAFILILSLSARLDAFEAFTDVLGQMEGNGILFLEVTQERAKATIERFDGAGVVGELARIAEPCIGQCAFNHWRINASEME